MYLLVVSFRNGKVEYFGPFPTLFRANEYAGAVTDNPQYARHHVQDLILPFNVVKQVVWR